MNTNIGEKLRQLRGDRSISVVANDLDISPSALSMYENNARIPRDRIKSKIAKYYGCTEQEIFYD